MRLQINAQNGREYKKSPMHNIIFMLTTLKAKINSNIQFVLFYYYMRAR